MINRALLLIILNFALSLFCFKAEAQSVTSQLNEDVILEQRQQTFTLTRAIAKLAIQTEISKIDTAAFDAAKLAMIDALGTALAGHNADGIKQISTLLNTWGGKPEATVWVYGTKLPVPEVTFMNSAMVHALDYDDVHLPSLTHTMSIILPVAMAMGESTGASGKEILTAIILGVEITGRLGVSGNQYLREGFLPTSILGGFGATAAACRLKGMSVDQTVDAMGIFYAHASGNRQALIDRTLTKRIQPAIGGKAAVISTCLAELGINGPDRVFEGDAGIMATYGKYDAMDKLMDNITEQRTFWEIERLSYKGETSCGHSNRVIRSAIDLSKKYNLKLADIDQIELFGIEWSKLVATPWNPNHKYPQVLAQFCAPYQVASAIKNGHFGPNEITEERVKSDKEVSDFAEKSVFIKSKDDFGASYPGGHTIRIRTKAGQIYVLSRDSEKGIRPEGEDELIKKFRENAKFSGLCSPLQADKIIESVKHLEQFSKISDFIDNYLVFRANLPDK